MVLVGLGSKLILLTLINMDDVNRIKDFLEKGLDAYPMIQYTVVPINLVVLSSIS